MCTSQVVWNLLTRELVLSHLEAIVTSKTYRILNLWAPHGVDMQAMLASVETLLHEEFEVSSAESVDIELLGELLTSNTQLNGQVFLLARGLDYLVGTDSFHILESRIAQLPANTNTTLLLVTNMPIIPWATNEMWQVTTNLQFGPLQLSQVMNIAQQANLDSNIAWHRTLGYAPSLQEWIDDPSRGDELIATHASAAALNDCSAETRDIAKVASLLPYFNVAALREVFDSGNFDDELYLQLTKSINELQALGIVLWDRDAGWYRFADGALRRLIARTMAAERQNEIVTFRERALRYFGAEAMHPAFLQYCIVSAIYHLATNSMKNAPAEVGETCLGWISQVKGGWQGADRYAVLRAWQTGGGDWHVKNELQSYLGVDSFNQITKEIGKALEVMP